MLRNYFKIAWRNLLKSKVYSSINIVGLAAGMAVGLLISFWIRDELSYNSYFSNHRRLALLLSTTTFNGKTSTGSGVAVPLANELRIKYPGDFKKLALISENLNHVLAVGNRKIEERGIWVQAEFPVMFSLHMLKGNQISLKDPSSILLTQSLAKILFGNAEPINQLIRLDNKIEMKVAGVFEDLPQNTTFFDSKFLLSWDNRENSGLESGWTNYHFQLFVQMSDQADFDKTSAKIKELTQPYVKGKFNEEILLQPIDESNLYNEFKNGKIVGGRIQFVWLFGMIGVFVLLLACINFMNLSTARSEKRAKEVGIRKAVGSMRGQLIGQFLCESLAVTLFAFLLAIIMVVLSLPFFNGLSDKQMSVPWINPLFWFLILIFIIFTGFVSGSYPAFYLSGFEPVKVLKGSFRTGRFASLPRRILVVVQFTVSTTLIIGTIVVFRQIQFAKNRPVGYRPEGLISVEMNTPEIQGHYDAIRNELIQTGAVENMAESSSPSTNVNNSMIGYNWKGKDPQSISVLGTIGVTHEFGKTLGWKIKEGRDFSRSFSTDTSAVILNESALKLMGFKHPLGEAIHWHDQDHFIIGVVKDLVMESPYSNVSPTIFKLDYGWTNYITVRITPTMPLGQALSKIEPVFKKYNPGSPFEYQFTYEQYARKFSDEQRIGNLATVFAILAIFISCLGLFGLASYVAEQRTKEIGVRKVLGASVFNLWKMLSKDFVVLVFISCLIAIPVASYFLRQWLQKYEYHTTITWWVFAVTIVGALVITLLTVSFQAIKAAMANPVKSLRTE
jgi:putative ABC transport system permease protein